jgi:hypothetical protein
MSPISIGLDGLLIMLLLITFTLGLRLNGRLKGLRADHANFAKAVGDLDKALAAAARALADLRAAGAEAQTVLGGRIQEARAAASRLEDLTAKATLAATAASPTDIISRAAEELGVLELGRAAAQRPAAPQAHNDPAPAPFEPRRDVRSRARVDEDLFETGAPAETPVRLRFAGGRR